MVLSTPNFEHAHGVVAELDFTNVNFATLGVNELLDDVAVTAGALIVNAQNGILTHEFDTSLHHAVELVGHFCIPTLHGVEIQSRVGFVFTTSLGGRCPAAHTDAVRRTTDFHDEHTNVTLLLLQVRVIDLTETRREHDGLDVLTTLAIGHALPESTAETQNDGLAKLVTIVRRAVGAFDENFQRRSQVGWIHRSGVFMGKNLTIQAQVTHHVTGGTSDERGSRTSGVRVTKTTAGTSFSTRVRRNTRRKVVRLSSE